MTASEVRPTAASSSTTSRTARSRAPPISSSIIATLGPNSGALIKTRYTPGSNLYAYVGNDPLNRVDPLGLYTLQIGGNIGYTLPFGLSGTYFVGVAFDTQGGIAGYYCGGIGMGLGVGASMSGSIIVSNAKTVNNLGGGFSNATMGVGTAGRVGLETFFGPSDNGFVSGIGVSAGVGLAGTSYAGPTNTVIVPATQQTSSK